MKRRTILLLMAMAAALVLSSTVALAVTRQCETGVDCYGTKKRDTLFGTSGGDSMYGKGRGDTLYGYEGSDTLYGQGGSDKLFGGPGGDFLYPGPGNDASEGGGDIMDRYLFQAIDNNWGKDTITDTPPDGDLVFGGPGDDTIEVLDGDGDDTVCPSGGRDVILTFDPGDDTDGDPICP